MLKFERASAFLDPFYNHLNAILHLLAQNFGQNFFNQKTKTKFFSSKLGRGRFEHNWILVSKKFWKMGWPWSLSPFRAPLMTIFGYFLRYLKILFCIFKSIFLIKTSFRAFVCPLLIFWHHLIHRRLERGCAGRKGRKLGLTGPKKGRKLGLTGGTGDKCESISIPIFFLFVGGPRFFFSMRTASIFLNGFKADAFASFFLREVKILPQWQKYFVREKKCKSIRRKTRAYLFFFLFFLPGA